MANPKTLIRKIVRGPALRAVENVFRTGRGVFWQTRYGFPARGMQVIAVTGTNGKTTTASYINRMLQTAGFKTAVYTTAYLEIDGQTRPNRTHMTVSSQADVQKFFSEARNASVDWVILEVTSHALDQGRIDGISVEIAVMTNLTQEHLDYHASMERYAAAKARLFGRRYKAKWCILNAASVAEDGCRLLSNVVASSMDLHAVYGGVVPEIAARSHIESIMPVISEAMATARAAWEDIDGIAVTYGPGLGGSLLVGVMTARTLAIAKNKPLYAVNHVTAHCYANFLTSTSLPGYSLPKEQPEFPMLALIVSGGHSQLVLFNNYFDYRILGRTRDDAVGEAFDKVAKIIGLPYPGGPSISKKAQRGDPKAYKLPKAAMENGYDFSYSGLKTAVLRTAQAAAGKSYDFPSFELAPLLTEAQKADLAASFQYIAVETAVDKTERAYQEFAPNSVIIAGGVAASQELRRQMSARLPVPIAYTDMKLCTDNGAMIATCGYFMAKEGVRPADPYSLGIAPNLPM